MKKQVFFGVLFCSWVFGVSLICLFPPIADYKVMDQNSGYLSLDATPELHIRNSSHTGRNLLELGIKYLISFLEFQFKPDLKLLVAFFLGENSAQIPSFFDSKILFQVFFETW